jgi:hypothetical protein
MATGIRTITNRKAPFLWSGAITDGLIVKASVLIGDDIWCLGISAYATAVNGNVTSTSLYKYTIPTDTWTFISIEPTGGNMNTKGTTYPLTALYESGSGKIHFYGTMNQDMNAGGTWTYNTAVTGVGGWSAITRFSLAVNEIILGAIAYGGYHYVLTTGLYDGTHSRIHKVTPTTLTGQYLGDLTNRYGGNTGSSDNKVVGINNIMYIIGGQNGGSYTSKLYAVDCTAVPPTDYFNGSVSAATVTQMGGNIAYVEGSKIIVVASRSDYRSTTNIQTFDTSGGFLAQLLMAAGQLGLR